MAHVWDASGGTLREVGTVSADGGERSWQGLAMSWEAGESLLVAASEEISGTASTVARWTSAGIAGLDGLPPTAGYHSLAFSPDCRTLWAAPSQDDPGWTLSDAVDLASGIIRTGPGWDTGIAGHPDGGLVAALDSEAGATHVVFARVDEGRAPAGMRPLRRALILDADGYAAPAFSPDGRYLAIRGSSYGHCLTVFEFPSLRRVLAAALGEPRWEGTSRQERMDWFRAWSWHNIAFGGRPGVLWTGTPAGILIETDLENHESVSHDVLAGSPVTGLAATADGDLIAATGGSELAFVSVTAGHPAPPAPDVPRSRTAEFLASTSVVPDLHAPWLHFVVTDGVRTWTPEDLETVTVATDADPAWLQMVAGRNKARSKP